MKNSMKFLTCALVVVLTTTVGACEKKEPAGKNDVKVVKTEVVKSFPTVMSLDKRVTVIEERNARIDANIRKARAAKVVK